MTKSSPRIAALLSREAASRPRLAFCLDATCSREGTWDLATKLQGDMFLAAAMVGGVDVQLVHFRGVDEMQASPWVSNAYELVSKMGMIRCAAGTTQIARVLAHVRGEHERQQIAAVIFVGDAVEEKPSELYDAAAGCPPLMMFQEGEELVMSYNQLGYPKPLDGQSVESVFRELAKITHGAFARFDSAATATLRELLQAVAVFAAGGTKALGDLRTESARKLLSQMK